MEQSAPAKILTAIAQLRSANNNNELNREHEWIMHHLPASGLQSIIPALSVVALHTLSALEDGEQTGIAIAGQLKVTRSAVTRAARRLLIYRLVTAQKHPGDRKKIYYRLTPDGEIIAKTHDQMHQVLRKQAIDQLAAKYPAADLETVANFLTDLVKAE
jgi:DNA-binding MarR family transcriptional regulator